MSVFESVPDLQDSDFELLQGLAGEGSDVISDPEQTAHNGIVHEVEDSGIEPVDEYRFELSDGVEVTFILGAENFSVQAVHSDVASNGDRSTITSFKKDGKSILDLALRQWFDGTKKQVTGVPAKTTKNKSK